MTSPPCADAVTVTFWGVRGSIPTPGYDTSRYGGNTLCVEVGFPGCGRTLIIDAGSGIRRLGDDLLGRSGRQGGVAVDLLLSHTHLDHILGLPFFQPLYRPDTRVAVYGPAISPEDRLEQVIGGQMSYRYFPVRQVELAAEIRYVDLREGAYDLGDGIRLSATYLNHPLLCMGYRIEYRGRALCTAFDTEPFRNLFVTDPADPRYDEMMAQEGEEESQAAALRMRAFARGADLLIHDGQFTEREYRAGRVGWGHSSVEYAVTLAEAAGSRRLALVHHDPTRTDDELDEMSQRYGGVRPGSGLEVCFAAEGLSVTL
ncbi:MAG: MBL fold metallo-hydrolase [Desulfobacterales bacterium]|nr:MBL fold metallo-hydrolase [Desulfobacterales bacterium]